MKDIYERINEQAAKWYTEKYSQPNVVLMSVALYRAAVKEQELRMRNMVWVDKGLDYVRTQRELFDLEEQGINTVRTHVGDLRIVVIDTPDEVLDVTREISIKEAMRMVAVV